MTFDVAADAYDSYMGRFSVPLAEVFAEWAGLPAGGRALDVGCGTGALTAALARRFGETEVAAVDPQPQFVEATAERFPWADVRHGIAEALPFDDDAFSATLAELVVHFMTDAAAAAREMVRVTRAGGVVAACVWDVENQRAPYSAFVRAAVAEAGDAGRRTPALGTRRGDLAALLVDAGCADVAEAELAVTVEFPGFDAWWEWQANIGSAAAVLGGLDDEGVARVRAHAHDSLGDGAIAITATAWAARGVA